MPAKPKKYKKPSGKAALTAQEKVSRYMRGNKSKNTTPEIKLKKALWQAGLRGYRIHWTKAPGKPDICYPSRRLAIFIHGCFWHRCPHCQLALPKSNLLFWQTKFDKNKQRDLNYQQLYREAGWQRLVIWECQLAQHIDSITETVKQLHKGVPYSHQVAA